MKNTIYGLVDPTTNELRYVGKAKCPFKRLREHLKPRSLKFKTHKNNWLNKLISNGLKPDLIILEKCENLFLMDDAEDFWISYFRGLGCNLTNSCNGGKGTPGYKHREESLEKMSKKALARDWSNFIPINKKENIFIDNKEHRVCSRCKETKEISNFWFNIKKNRYHPYCKRCNADSFQEYKSRHPFQVLSEEEYNKSRLPGAKAGGIALANNPIAKAIISRKLSKPIIATHLETGKIIEFESALKAKEAGFQNSNIGQAIKYNRPYKGYNWKFKI